LPRLINPPAAAAAAASEAKTTAASFNAAAGSRASSSAVSLTVSAGLLSANGNSTENRLLLPMVLLLPLLGAAKPCSQVRHQGHEADVSAGGEALRYTASGAGARVLQL
jgi:negative regulator of sigma E activity